MISRGPIARRIALATAAAVSIVAAAGLAAALTMAGRFASNQFNAALEADMSGLKAIYAQRFVPGVRQAVQQRSLDGALLLFLDQGGEALAGRIPRWPTEAQQGAFRFRAEIAGETRELQGLSHVFDGSFRLLVARDRAELDAIAAELKRLGLLLIPAILAAAWLAGWLTSRILARRIAPFETLFASVSTGNLSLRAPDEGNDEFSGLARSINQMLAQIDRLVVELGALSDRVAHELRTPLMRLQANLDRVRGKAGAEAAPFLDSAANEMRHIRQTFEAVLEVASNRALTGDRRGLRPVVLSDIATSTVELYEPSAEEKGLVLTWQLAAVRVLGDEDLLIRLIANLLDNAIKFTPQGGTISVVLAAAGTDRFCFTVTDSGPGMAGDFASHATELFARAPEADGVSGSGLGLSLVAAIAARHGFRLRFLKASPGLTVELTGKTFSE